MWGEYRAPRARARLNEHRWFCVEHVREYNKKWDYFAGHDAEAIEAHIRADTTWRRPVWPLGGRSSGGFFSPIIPPLCPAPQVPLGEKTAPPHAGQPELTPPRAKPPALPLHSSPLTPPPPRTPLQ